MWIHPFSLIDQGPSGIKVTFSDGLEFLSFISDKYIIVGIFKVKPCQSNVGLLIVCWNFICLQHLKLYQGVPNYDCAR